MVMVVLSAFAGDALTIEVRGLTHPGGPVICTAYDRAEHWLKRTGYAATTRVEVAGATATCRFEDLAPGTYAVSFFHDVDGDGELTANWMGLPKEPWGVSRDAPMAFGPPKFEAAAFAHPGPIEIAHVR